MNDQQIYEFLARKPDSRAQDIADAMDVELKVASDALRALVDCGDVVRHAGIARNGLSAQLYHLSVEYRRGRDYQAIMSKIVASASEVQVAPAPVSKPPVAAAFETPVLADLKELKPPRTKVEMAIDYLAGNPNADDAQMRAAMGLPKTSSPTNYLASAMRAGRVVKSRYGWNVGPGIAPDKNQRAPYNPPPVSSVPAAVSDVTLAGPNVVPPYVVPDADGRAALANQISDLPKGIFRCGLWSDGVIEMQRGDTLLAKLSRAEAEQMAEFMGWAPRAADKAAA